MARFIAALVLVAGHFGAAVAQDIPSNPFEIYKQASAMLRPPLVDGAAMPSDLGIDSGRLDQGLHTDILNPPPVVVVTDLATSDFQFGASQTELSAALSGDQPTVPRIEFKPFGQQDPNVSEVYEEQLLTSLTNFCKIVQGRRQDFQPKPMPLYILGFRWLREDDRDQLNACSQRTGPLSFGASFVVEIPIAVRAPVFLTRDEQTLPHWLRPEHLIVASLAGSPVLPHFGPEWTKSQTCEALSPQPSSKTELAAALKTAECAFRDKATGVWRVGSYRETLLAYNDHLDSSHRDFSELAYDPPRGDANPLGNWSWIDYAIRNFDIRLTVEQSAQDEAINLCLAVPQLRTLIESHAFPDFQLKALCSWRQDARSISGPPETRSDGDPDPEVTVTSIGQYLTGGYSGMFAVGYNRSGDISEQADGRRDELKKAIAEGQYPFTQMVWLYLDPAALADKGVAEVLKRLLYDPPGEQYSSSLALLSMFPRD